MGGGYGWHQPWPLTWGGGPTEDEAIYQAWRDALGSLPAKDDSGIDGLWRQCRSSAIASVDTFVERAVMQAFPQVATDHLRLWEEYLGINPVGTDEERRRAVVSAYIRKPRADGPTIAEYLENLDSRFSIKDYHPSKGVSTVIGMPFSSRAANFSTDYRLQVLLSGGDPTNPLDLDILQTAKAYLNEVLPAWIDFQLATSVGFYLDSSPLDYTMLTSR